jgi:hypothetical protein
VKGLSSRLNEWLNNNQSKYNVNNILYDDLLLGDNDKLVNKYKDIKCPEIKLKLNNVEVTALVDTGSQINGISEQWFNNNQSNLGRFEILNLSNTTVKGAMGNKSKLIRKQVLLEVNIGNYTTDVVFLVIPALSRDCIIGMSLMNEAGCIIDLPRQQIQFTRHNEQVDTNRITTAEIFNIETPQQQQPEDIQHKITHTVNSIDTLDDTQKQRLREILIKYKAIFADKPGRINGYQHEIRVTDPTPFYQKGWPVPIAYQEKVDAEINKMLEYGVIERSNSQYVNPLVTIIKKDKSVRLCLDAFPKSRGHGRARGHKHPGNLPQDKTEKGASC